MDPPPIRYVKTSDGVNIAYWSVGHGDPVIQLPSLPHSHIQMEWDIPEWRRGYELAAEIVRIIRYDGRGTGLSQRDVSDFSIEAMIADLDAVVGELGGQQVALHGIVNTCPVAIAYAARFPERVSHLILWIPVVDGSIHRTNQMLQAARQVAMRDWRMFSETVAHSLLGWSEPESARRFAELIREGIDERTILTMVESIQEYDVREILTEVRCPTLILHRPDTGLLPPGTAEGVAAAIPDSRLVVLDGQSSVPYLGDWRSISRRLAEFLGVSFAPAQRASRPLRLLSMRTEALTPRERDVVSRIARGLSNRRIAEELFLAEKTVENHVGRILVKLDVGSRAELAAYAVEHGLTGKSA